MIPEAVQTMKTQMILLPEEIRAADSLRIPVTIIPEIMEITVTRKGKNWRKR